MRLASGTEGQAHRDLVFAQGPGWLEIWYGDGPQAGTLMHRFEVSKGQRAEHLHTCAPDAYAASLRIAEPCVFQLSYVVTGPRKAYRMSTLYRKDLTGAACAAP